MQAEHAKPNDFSVEKPALGDISEKDVSQDNTTDDIIGTTTYEAEQRKKKEFWPWHKPRKQYVREYQWCQEIRRMIAEILPENNILKYLGLPGDDFLDLRYFHEEICRPNNLQLKFLGFNEGIRSDKRKTEINISLDELSHLEFIHPSYEVIPDDFCDIARVNSFAWEKTRQKGPYDIINIDLCDGFGKQAPDKTVETHYTTISKLLSLQEKRPNPWLLLITTRTGRNDIHEDVLKRLQELFKNNLKDCEPFLKASSEKLGMTNDEQVEENCSTEKGLSDVFLISLCKWLAQIAIKHKSKMEVKSAVGYKVHGKATHLDLVSIAIRVDPLVIIQEDKIGLAQRQEVDPLPDECLMAVQALESIYGQVDADKVLADDKTLWDEMLSQSSKLLEAARYDVAGYKAWANSMVKVQTEGSFPT